MPLVDYASSDEGSEDESGEIVKDENNQNYEKPINPDPEKVNIKDKATDEGNPALFSALPKPRTNLSFLGDDNKLSKLLLNKNSSGPFGQKSEKESIKISVPSVSEFDDDTDEPATKKIKPSAKGVGLFSILPPPKNESTKDFTKKLVPHAVAKNQGKKTPSTETSFLKSGKNSTVVKQTETTEEDEEDVNVGSSFFGLSEPSVSGEPEKIPNNENVMYETTQSETNQNVPDSYNWSQPIPEDNSYSNFNIEDYTYPVDVPEPPEIPIPLENNPLELDEKALQILCGNKKKRQHMPMNIIDLSGEEIMPDSKEWLLKQFTEEKKGRSHGHGHSHRRSDGPSSQSRRKHQITYLAFQAKEQELELQNQWANNRMSRKQTQSKYGF